MAKKKKQKSKFQQQINQSKKNQPKQKQRVNTLNKSKRQNATKQQKTAVVNQTTKLPINNNRFSKKQIWLWLTGIVLITFIVYFPSLRNDITNWDDNSYIESSGFTHEINAENLNKMFFGENKYHMGNYHPLTMLSIAIDYQINKSEAVKKTGLRMRGKEVIKDNYRKVDPFIYHLTNIIIHLINTVLVFWFIYLLFSNFKARNRFAVAIITALLFGISTIHVESVTWVSERKDVLYTMFFLASLNFYLKFINKNNWGLFALSFLMFFLSLLSKGQAVSLSVTLIAIDILKKRNILSLKVILEKVPYFALALTFGIIAIKAQAAGEAIHELDEFGFQYRILFATYGTVMYFVKMFMPIELAAIYPYPHFTEGVPPINYFFFPIPFLLIVAAFVWAWKKNKEVAFGLAFFGVNIALLLQLIPVGSAIMADRYAYIPSIGFFLLFGLAFRWIIENRQKFQKIFIGVLAVYSVFLSIRTYQQTKVWKNSMTLWNHTLEHEPTALVAWNNRGSAKEKAGDKVGAVADFTEALKIKDDYTHAYYNRGTAKKDIALDKLDPKAKAEGLQDAIIDFNRALVLDPNFAEAYHNRGICLENLGKYKEAIADYNKGLELSPNLHSLYSSRGVAKGKSGDLEGAIEDFNKSIELKPDNPEAYSNRGFAKVKLDKLSEGLKDYDIALQIDPKSADARYNRGIGRFHSGNNKGALEDLTYAIQMRPNFGMCYFQRGIIYAKMNKKNEACADFANAQKLGIGQAKNYSEQIGCN